MASCGGSSSALPEEVFAKSIFFQYKHAVRTPLTFDRVEAALRMRAP
jgi:hypothetical protein